MGIENAPEAFIGLLKGGNFGKLLVKVKKGPRRRRLGGAVSDGSP